MRFNRLTALAAFAAVAGFSTVALAQDPPAAPAAPAAPVAPAAVTKALPGAIQVSNAKTIAENVAAAPALGDFAAALKAADLTEMLSGTGPFTVFIPTRGAFARLEAGTQAGWMKPEGKRKLTAVINYHMINGALPSDALAEQVKTGKGEAPLATLQGGYITVKGGARNLNLTDVNGSHVRIIAEAPASNGVIYLVDGVLQP